MVKDPLSTTVAKEIAELVPNLYDGYSLYVGFLMKLVNSAIIRPKLCSQTKVTELV